MTTRSSNIIVLIIFGSFITYRTVFPADSTNSYLNTLFNVSIEIVGSILLFVILQFLQNIKHFWFYFQTQFLYRNEEIRLSIAYLFRINVDGKYLLVKSRTRNYFQPVGGAFKSLPGSEKVFDRLKVKPDRLIETENGIAKSDLRIYVKGINVIEFLDWFKSKEDRETSPWREFCEELISTNILPWRQFRFIDYKFKDTIQSPIITLDNGSKGIFIFEVYDLIINSEQKPIFEELIRKGNTETYIWVDDYLIQRLGHDERTKTQIHEISPHTKFAQNLRWGI
jgi:SMODS-associated NUDIX domain